ncbi:hypothetical protein ACFC09_42970 [Streptomyces sp. NPDC056161]|uniref:hypothetical protein n=1 Tax=Streptomyces sp. NPDC056161 TaxID=3345732 RepID=UPI0035DAA5A4
MGTFMEAATGPLSILFTAALVVVVCFWLLVALGAATANSFDADIDLGPWGMGGVPVAVALSLLTVLAWLLGVAAHALLLAALLSAGAVGGALHVLASAVSLAVAWRLTRLFVRPLHRRRTVGPRPARGSVRGDTG